MPPPPLAPCTRCRGGDTTRRVATAWRRAWWPRTARRPWSASPSRATLRACGRVTEHASTCVGDLEAVRVSSRAWLVARRQPHYKDLCGAAGTRGRRAARLNAKLQRGRFAAQVARELTGGRLHRVVNWAVVCVHREYSQSRRHLTVIARARAALSWTRTRVRGKSEAVAKLYQLCSRHDTRSWMRARVPAASRDTGNERLHALGGGGRGQPKRDGGGAVETRLPPSFTPSMKTPQPRCCMRQTRAWSLPRSPARRVTVHSKRSVFFNPRG